MLDLIEAIQARIDAIIEARDIGPAEPSHQPTGLWRGASEPRLPIPQEKLQTYISVLCDGAGAWRGNLPER